MKRKDFIKKIIEKPQIIAIIGDRHSGKSLTNAFILNELNKNFDFKLYTFGFKGKLNKGTEINSTEEMERTFRSMVSIEEMPNLFDFEDRKKKKEIEKTLRLLNHKNNIVILIGLPENFKKFISSKVDLVIYKSCTISDFINGSSVKKTLLSYCGEEIGSKFLNLRPNEALMYDGEHYNKVKIPYLKEFDTKKDNKPIFTKKENCGNFCVKDVRNFVEKKESVKKCEEDYKKGEEINGEKGGRIK